MEPGDIINTLSQNETRQRANADAEYSKKIEQSELATSEKAIPLIQKYQQKKEEERLKALRAEQERFDRLGTHSRPTGWGEFTKKRAQEIQEKIGSEQVMEVPQSDITASPSIHHEITGETFLAKSINLPRDTEKSYIVNDFIVKKMEIQALEDTPQNYDNLLDQLLERIGVTRGHKSDYIVQKIYLYLTGGNRYNEDNLVMTIMKNSMRRRR